MGQEQEQQAVKADEQVAVVQSQEVSQFEMVADTFERAMEYAQLMAKSNLVPKAYQGHPEDILLAVQMGQEVGLKPMQAVQGICVINGMPSIWGQALSGLVQNNPVCEYLYLTYDKVTKTATCRTKRTDRAEEEVFTFDAADAKQAGLDGKDTYKKYPQNMYRWKALGNCCKFVYGDVTKGLIVAEDALDYPKQRGDSGAQSINKRVQQERDRRSGKPEPEVAKAVVMDEAPNKTVSQESAPEPAREAADPAELMRIMTEAGLQSTNRMDRLCAMVLGDPVAVMIDLSDVQIRKMEKATALVSQLAGRDIIGFISYCSTNGLILDTGDTIKETFAAYQTDVDTDEQQADDAIGG